MEPVLKRCPFCGEAAQWFKEGRSVGVECLQQEDCPGRAQTNTYDPEHRDLAVDAWNLRRGPVADVWQVCKEEVSNQNKLVYVCDPGMPSAFPSFEAASQYIIDSLLPTGWVVRKISPVEDTSKPSSSISKALALVELQTLPHGLEALAKRLLIMPGGDVRDISIVTQAVKVLRALQTSDIDHA